MTLQALDESESDNPSAPAFSPLEPTEIAPQPAPPRRKSKPKRKSKLKLTWQARRKKKVRGFRSIGIGIGIGHNRGPPLDTPLMAVLEDRVMTFAEWCQLNGIGIRTGRRILRSGTGPAVL
jgi:hypothetical protein